MRKTIGHSVFGALAASAVGLAFLTSAQAGLFNANFNDNQVPPGSAVYGDKGDGNAGVISNGVLILTRAVLNNKGGFIIEDLDGGVPISGFTATFKLLIGNGSGAAGFSFNFAPDLPDGTIGEEGAGSDLRVCFDTYQDGGGDVAPAIDLKNAGDNTATGGIVGSVLGIEPVFRQSKFVDVWIQVKSDNTLSMTVDNTVIFTNFYGAFTASAGRFGFGAASGGSLGDNHWLDDIHIETSTNPVVVPVHPLVVTNSPTGGGVPAEPAVHLAIKDFTTQVKTNTVQLLFNGVLVAPAIAKAGEITTVDYDPPGALAPLSANTYTLIFDDTGAYTTAITYGFTTAQYRSAVLPAPVYFENFDTTDEGSLPTGWTQTNATTAEPGHEGLNLADVKSDSYLGWTVVDRSRFEGGPLDSRFLFVSVDYLNGVLITNLIDGHCAFAASTGRSGANNLANPPPYYNQIQMLFSPDFDLSGKNNIYLAYNSIYTQNQDNLGAVEYSTNQGVSWLPVIYMLDASGTNPGGYDIVTNALGQVDGYLTFTQPRTDTPIIVDSAGLTNRYSFWYEFISARPLASLGPYVSGRWNDDQRESRRFEVFRLPQADNQAKVRFCFTQVGTSSWGYGIDNFGLYSIPSPTLSIARIAADKVTLSWGPTNAVGFTLQRSTTVANPQWATVSTGVVSNSVTLTIGATNQFFRLIR